MIKFIGSVFILCSFFPYISPVDNPFDSQPYAIILGIIFIFLCLYKGKRITSEMYPLLIVFYTSLILLIFDCYLYGFSSITLRAFANYLSISFFPLAFYLFFTRYGFPDVLLKISIKIYFIAAVIQLTFSKHIFDFIIHARTTGDRGVTSLAPEPTFYGIICYLFLIVILLSDKFKKKDKVIYGILLVIQIILFAKSSMAVLYLVFLILGITLSSKMISTTRIFIIGCVCSLSLYLMFEYNLFEGTRLSKIIDMATVGGIYVFGQDASMNQRLSHIYFSIYGVIQNITLPGLFSSFEYLLDQKKELSAGFFWYGGSNNKIMSYIGAIVYEMGFLSIFYFVVLFRSFKKNKLFMYFSFVIPLMAAVPLANPIVGFIIALGIMKIKYRTQPDVF